MDAAEIRAADALNVIGERLSEVFRIHEQANAETVRGAIAVAAAIARKLFPDLDRRNQLGEVEAIVRTSMDRTMAVPRIVVHVNDSLTDDLSARIAVLRSETDFAGELVVAGDPNLQDGDCRIEWKDGGAERDTNALWQEIDEIIKNNLGADEPQRREATHTPAPEDPVFADAPAPDEGSSESGAEIATDAGVRDDAVDAFAQASPVEPAPQAPEPAQDDQDSAGDASEPAAEGDQDSAEDASEPAAEGDQDSAGDAVEPAAEGDQDSAEDASEPAAADREHGNDGDDHG